MDCIVVTLDVSKLSGWLNADAICRVKRDEVRAGSREGVGKPRRCKQRVQGGPDCED